MHRMPLLMSVGTVPGQKKNKVTHGCLLVEEK